jgi:hypothetical protein
MDLEDYQNKVVSATADGASVNMGCYRGVLTQLKDRVWLLILHCINHRIELAVKDSFKEESAFDEVEEFYISLFYYLKNSGAIKAYIVAAANTIDITHYVLPKITGTRFVGHRRKAFQVQHLLEFCIFIYVLCVHNNISSGSSVVTILKRIL